MSERFNDRPDMVVRSAEGDRWGALGRSMTPAEREQAVDDLLANVTRRLRAFQEAAQDV